MDARTLKENRRTTRARLRRAAWDQIGASDLLDMEHFLEGMADAFGTHRGRLVSRAFIARGMTAAGASPEQIAAALTVEAAAVGELLTRKLFADPQIAAAIDRKILEEFPDSLLTFGGLQGPALVRAQAEAAAQLR